MQANIVLSRGRMRRVLGAWQGLIEERWWRTQIGTRDHEIQHLALQVVPAPASYVMQTWQWQPTLKQLDLPTVHVEVASARTRKMSG